MTHDPTFRLGDAGTARTVGGPAPGTIIGDRFRIVSLLGRGGMGEVYLAEDLRLGQKVALKFLPEHARTAHELEALYREVRIGRQIAHPNVCRLYDLIEIGAQQFLSMEHIEGEDLQSLIDRVRRLPRERALAIAKDICAGLEAIHSAGVLHRDLKPGNILIDASGHAHITDFGIASRAGETSPDDAIAGTPAYMAPEAFRSAEATRPRDLYALGVVLYELFTGTMPMESAPEVTPPGHLVPDLDPVIDRVILQCLAADPARRPPSAAAVGAALPGADPLQIALAAGETPSRQMVAEAVSFRGLPAVSLAIVVAFAIVGFAAITAMSRQTMLHRRAGLLPRAELERRAMELIRRAAPGSALAYRASWFATDSSELRAIAEKDLDVSTLQTSPIRFALRVSPEPLVPLYRLRSDRPPQVSLDDPPHDLPGMATVVLDGNGQLRLFRAGRSAIEPAGLVEAAGLASPNATGDGLPVTIESDTGRDGAVSFSVAIGEREAEEPPSEIVAEVVQLLVIALVLIAAILLSRRNLRRGRGDRVGAFRFATTEFVLWVAAWIAGTAHRSTIVGHWWTAAEAASHALFWSGLMWVAYVALEPVVRRHWPQILAGWTRLFDGRWLDGLVGRDILAGVVGGIALAMFRHLMVLLPPLFGIAEPLPLPAAMSDLSGLGSALENLFFRAHTAMFNAVGSMITFLLLRLLVRRFAVATLLWIPLIVIINFGGRTDVVSILLLVLFVVTMLLLLNRYGLLTLAIALFVNFNLRGVLPQMSAAVIAGLLLYGAIATRKASR